MKKLFRDVDNVLYDWTDSPSSDYCAWRGITCDNVTFNVVALWVTVSLDIACTSFHFLLRFYLLQQSFRVESWWGNFTCNREASEFGLYVIFTILRPFFWYSDVVGAFVLSCLCLMPFSSLFYTVTWEKTGYQGRYQMRLVTVLHWRTCMFLPWRTEFSLYLYHLETYLELWYLLCFQGLVI